MQGVVKVRKSDIPDVTGAIPGGAEAGACRAGLEISDRLADFSAFFGSMHTR